MKNIFHRYNKESLFFCLLLLNLFISPAAIALKSDETATVYIASESAELDRSTGVGIYRHDVKIDQGSTHITGETITTRNDANNKIEEAIIEGGPESLAHYWTLPEEDKPELHAKAKIIQFYPQKQYAILIGNASVTQGNNSIQGQRIEYDIKKQLLKSVNESGNKDSRTTIVIEPGADQTSKIASSKKSDEKGNKS